MLHAYCLSALSENRQVKRAVGIAIDASPRVTGRKVGSEDLLALDVEKWTPGLEEELREARKEFDIMRPDRVRREAVSFDEYPTPPDPSHPPGLNRQQRRAMERVRRKANRKR